MSSRTDPTTPTRRGFLRRAGLLGVLPALMATDHRDFGVADASAVDTASLPFPLNDPERVRTVVGASHGNIDVVRTLVTEQPALARGSWDWQLGDWETPLGAASHVGRRDIAELLIAHGARPSIFSAAMMGRLAVVRAYLEADPTLFRLPGPHGISLTRHAEAGGADAEDVAGYLLERFGPDPLSPGVRAGDAEEARYGGRYRFDTDPSTEVAIGVRNGWLMVGLGDQPTGRLLAVEDTPDAFRFAGAPAVLLTFRVRDGRAVELHLQDGPFTGTGRLV